MFGTLFQPVFGQQKSLAVLSFDAQSSKFDSRNLTELLRIEISGHQRYEILDRYSISELMDEHKMDPTTCFSKNCLLEAGKILSVDKVCSGSVDVFENSIYIRLRFVDVQEGVVEKEVVKEFSNVPEKINTMLTLAVNDMFGVPNDELLEKSLSSTNNYENAVNNPEYPSLSLSGPRMGYTFLTGDAAQIMKKPRSQGGYDAYPALFQFGYQFEKQYLNEGKVQALFEFLPMISGLDQGLFIPSFTVMNGLRNSVNGLELAIGPSINFVKQSYQFQDSATGEWFSVRDRSNEFQADEVLRLDSRGSVYMKSYVVIAVGYSFKSGRMNIPVNAYVIPAKDNFRFGLSFGVQCPRKSVSLALMTKSPIIGAFFMPGGVVL